MNNARYYELFDTAVNAHLFEATGVNVRTLPAIGVVAETSCRYFREIGFPEPIDMGLVAERVGTSSVIYRIGLFKGVGPGGRRGAVRARVRRQRRRPGDRPVRPIPDVIRTVAEALVLPGGRPSAPFRGFRPGLDRTGSATGRGHRPRCPRQVESIRNRDTMGGLVGARRAPVQSNPREVVLQ